MKPSLFRRLLLAALFGAVPALAADQSAPPADTANPGPVTEELLKENLAAYNQEQAAREKAAKDRAAKAKAEKAKADAKAASPGQPAPAAPTPATVLPEFTVSASRISELDIQIKKLEKQIEREKKHLKSSKLDEALNGAQTPKVLSIFGGKTTAQRESVAADRVTFLEGERDILEAMKHVRTKQDNDQLQAQLEALKTMSRDLDETLR